MSPDIPPAPPEAEVIRLARLAADMTAESAAEATRAHDGKGVSASYWRDVERGRGYRRGQAVPVRASERALAVMARVVDVTPAQLTAAGREDAARVLTEIQRRDNPPVPERPVRVRVNKSMARTEDLVPIIRDIAQELADGKEPSAFEQVIWDSDISQEEKWNLAAKLRKAARTPAREAETGLVTAGAGPFTAS